MMVTLDRMRIMQILADATNAIAEGEVLQLMNAHDPNTTEQRYIDVIRRKTARLFEAGAQIAAVLSTTNTRRASPAGPSALIICLPSELINSPSPLAVPTLFPNPT